MAVNCGKLISIDTTPIDHSYYNSPGRLTSRNFLQSVTNELNILKNSLPAGIIVKHYADRLDLMSVLIKGPDETVYEDSLFLFDLKLPGDYPNYPPSVVYKSYSNEKVNPNLYTCGMVCLSLLGTWHGHASCEMWSKNSTLLQVVVSIQSLILVKEPFYNEPAYANVPDFERSKRYNVDIFQCVIESQIKMFKKPPTVFKDEVIRHVLSVKEKITKKLLLCKSKDTKFCNDYVMGKLQNTGVIVRLLDQWNELF